MTIQKKRTPHLYITHEDIAIYAEARRGMDVAQLARMHGTPPDRIREIIIAVTQVQESDLKHTAKSRIVEER